MTHTKSKTRYLALILAALMLIGLFPTSAFAASIADGSTSVTVSLGNRQYYLKTTAGTSLGASAYQYTTNDGITGPAYCINHGLNFTSRTLPITGKYTASVATAAAFATGYPQHSLATFLGRYPGDSLLNGLTEDEYAYATQLAVWATLGQLAVDGTAFTSGREKINQPTGDTQQMRVFHVIQLILNVANSWERIYQPGMYICAEDGKLGANVSIPGDMTLDFAANSGRYGFRREVIGGVSYYTREYTFCSATSTYYSDYNIEVWAENAPSGAIFTDTSNNELPRGTFQGVTTWTLPTEQKSTTLNENGFEYSGKAKLCLPVETTPNKGKITVKCGAFVMQYDIYLAKNEINSEQSYIIADPSKGTLTANGVLNWGSEETEKGDLQVIKVNGGGQPLAGAVFTLTGSDGSSRTGTTNDEGIIEWKLLDPTVTYTLTETTAPAGYAIVDPINVRVEAARVNYVTVQDSTQKRLTVKKIDKQTGYSLMGAVIAFEQIDGDFYTTGTTDQAGVIQMDADQLPVGSYKVYEITPPVGYELDSTAQTVNWTGRNDVTLTFNNVRTPTLIIYKCDGDNTYSLPNATFEVYKSGQLVTTVATNDNGLAYVPNVTTGYYTVKEIVAPAGYVLDSTEHSVYVDNYNPATTDDPRVTVHNSAMPMLRIVKYDAQTMKPLPDTTFAVYRDTELVGEYTTDANGEILLYDLTPGTYLVQEIAAPGTHVVNSTPQQIELEAGTQNYTLVFLNYVKPGIHLTKLDSQTMRPLANARFRITEIGGTFSQEYMTDPNGEIDLTGLTPGSYTVEELAAPDGYLIDDAQRIIKINAGENAVFVFTDTRKPTLKVLKYDAQREKLLSGATFRVARIEDGSHYLDRITGTDGSFTIENLTPGVYSVQEIEAPRGYIVNDTEYHVQLYPGQTAQLIVCDEKKPDLKIVKKDADTGAFLAGATFKVNRADGSTLTTEQTDANGEVFLKELDPGVYQITEVTPPTGYLPAEQPTQLITLEPNKLGTAVFENHAKPTLTINKIDSVTRDPIPSVKFRVDYASNQTFTGETNSLGDFYTDEDGKIVIDALRDGWYKVTELAAPTGYAIADPAAQEFYILAGTGKTVTFENTPLSALCVFKYDSVTGEAVKNAVFQVKYLSGTSGTGGTVIGTYKTSANGSFTVTNLQAGTYIVEELASDSGHVIDTAPQTAYISGEPQAVVQLYFGNAPKGSVLIKKIDSVTRAPLSDVRFFVTDSSGAVIGNGNGYYTTDSAGTILIENLDPGLTVIAKETAAKSGYVLDDTPQTAKVLSGETVTLEFRNAPKGALIVQKYDSITKAPLSGAKFKITAANGELVPDNEGLTSSNGLYTTDAQGQIVLSKLAPGTYIVTEETAPTGYIKDATPKTIVVRSGAANSLTFDNEPSTTLIIRKFIEGTQNEPLSGVAFKVEYGDGAAVGPDDGVYYTDKAGEITLSGLEPGKTVIAREIKTLDGYVLDGTPQDIVIEAGAVQRLTFWNRRAGALVIRKLDSATKAPLAGAEFSVVYADGRYVDNADGHLSSNGLYTTNAQGEVVISGLTGTVVVTEEKAPDGYILDPNSRTQTVTVNPDDTQTLVFYNTAVGGLIITKSDEETGERISGVQFEVRKLNGEIVGQYTTDRNGVIRLPGLDSGWYAVTELKAASGYLLDPTPQQVEVKDGQTATLELANRKTSRVLIHKIDADTGKGIYGVVFLLYDGDHNPIGEYVSDQDGYVYMDDGLADGRYYVREIKAADGYILDNELKTIYVQYGATSEITWKNTAIRGQIQILKKSADDNPINGLPAGTPLEGAVFEVYDKSNRLVDTIRTDRNGRAASKLLPLSRYTVKEVQAPNYYAINPTVMNAYLEHEGQIVSFEVLDESLSTGVSIKKTGYAEVMPGQPIRYTITDIANTSTVPLGSFYWRDSLPGQIALEKVVTGTYNQKLAYKIVYKTNLSGDQYRTLADNLSTAKNYVLEARPAALGLAANERVTEIMFVFGTVKAGFAEVETAYIYGRVNSGLSNGSSIVNVVDVGGLYNGQWIQGVSRWLTKVYAKTTPLPKTGY